MFSSHRSARCSVSADVRSVRRRSTEDRRSGGPRSSAGSPAAVAFRERLKPKPPGIAEPAPLPVSEASATWRARFPVDRAVVRTEVAVNIRCSWLMNCCIATGSFGSGAPAGDLKAKGRVWHVFHRTRSGHARRHPRAALPPRAYPEMIDANPRIRAIGPQAPSRRPATRRQLVTPGGYSRLMTRRLSTLFTGVVLLPCSSRWPSWRRCDTSSWCPGRRSTRWGPLGGKPVITIRARRRRHGRAAPHADRRRDRQHDGLRRGPGLVQRSAAVLPSEVLIPPGEIAAAARPGGKRPVQPVPVRRR